MERAQGRQASSEETLAVTASARSRPKNGEPLRKTGPLPGVLIAELVRCGKRCCRCTVGERHGPYLYRRWREGGRQRRAYVPADEAERVRAAIAAWRRLHPSAYAVRRELTALRRLLRELEEGGS
jgi:Family of unknown function (DUF6788)